MSAEVTIERREPGRAEFVLREGRGGLVTFLVFVAAVTVALHYLVPAAREYSGPLWAAVALALVWAAMARGGREEYVVDVGAGVITTQWSSVLRQRTLVISTHEVTGVRLAHGGPDNDRRLVEILGLREEVCLRLPRRVTTLSAADQATIGEIFAEQLGVRLQRG